MDLNKRLILLKQLFADAVIFNNKNYYADYINLLYSSSEFNLRVNHLVLKSALENKTWGAVADAAYICFHELLDLTKQWATQVEPTTHVELRDEHSLEDLANKFADKVVDELKR